MTNTSNEPKELYIERQPNSNLALVAEPGETRSWQGVRMIEYTAYQALQSKYDEMKSYLPKVPTQPYEKELAEQNAALRAKLAEAEETIEFVKKVNHSNTEVHFQDMKEAQARIAELESIIAGKTFSYPDELNNANEKIQALEADLERVTEEKRQLQIAVSKATDEIIPERDALKVEAGRLKKIIAKELSENDELGAEYTYVNVLKSKVQALESEIRRTEEQNQRLREMVELETVKQLRSERDTLKAQLINRDEVVKRLKGCVGQYHEYFKAIERGEYNDSGTPRPSPLRQFEAMLQHNAENALAECKALEGKS